MKRKIIIKTEAHRREVLELVHRIPLTGAWSVTFAETSKRTLQQNRFMWLLLGALESQAAWYGHKLKDFQWKELLSASVTKQLVLPNLENDGFVSIGQKTSNFTVEEENIMIEIILHVGAEQNVKFPADTKGE